MLVIGRNVDKGKSAKRVGWQRKKKIVPRADSTFSGDKLNELGVFEETELLTSLLCEGELLADLRLNVSG